jgi:hypothetical protein
MDIFLRYFNAKVDREDIFKPILGYKSLHEISNDNGVRAVNFSTSKNLTVMSTQCSHSTTFINSPGQLLMERHTTRLTTFS